MQGTLQMIAGKKIKKLARENKGLLIVTISDNA